VLSDINDLVWLLTEMLEKPAKLIRVRILTKYVPQIVQNCHLIYLIYDEKNQFLLRLNATSLCQSLRARRISVTSVNIRRRADTRFRSEYRAAFDCTIDRRWSYIWFSVKWNLNMASSSSNIRHFAFIKTLFCPSYIIHAPTVKSDPRLAPLHKSDRIPYCQCFENT